MEGGRDRGKEGEGGREEMQGKLSLSEEGGLGEWQLTVLPSQSEIQGDHNKREIAYKVLDALQRRTQSRSYDGLSFCPYRAQACCHD